MADAPVADSVVEMYKTMFPAVPAEIVETTYEQRGGNEDAIVKDLIEMTEFLANTNPGQPEPPKPKASEPDPKKQVVVTGEDGQEFACVVEDFRLPCGTSASPAVAGQLKTQLSKALSRPAAEIRLHYPGWDDDDFFAPNQAQDGMQFTMTLRTRSPSWGLHIKTLTGKTVDLTVDPEDNILDMKFLYQDLEGIPIDQTRFIYAGKQPGDGCEMKEIGVQNGDIFHAVLRLRGD